MVFCAGKSEQDRGRYRAENQTQGVQQGVVFREKIVGEISKSNKTEDEDEDSTSSRIEVNAIRLR